MNHCISLLLIPICHQVTVFLTAIHKAIILRQCGSLYICHFLQSGEGKSKTKSNDCNPHRFMAITKISLRHHHNFANFKTAVLSSNTLSMYSAFCNMKVIQKIATCLVIFLTKLIDSICVCAHVCASVKLYIYYDFIKNGSLLHQNLVSRVTLHSYRWRCYRNSRFGGFRMIWDCMCFCTCCIVEETWTYIGIFYHFEALRWLDKLESFTIHPT